MDQGRLRKTRWTVLLAVLVAASLLPSCKGCRKEDDEVAIRALIEQARKLAQEQNVKELMALATQDLTTVPQAMSRQEVSMTLMMAFRRYEDFTILYPHPGVTVEPSKTEATADITFIVVRRGGQAPDLGSFVEDPRAWLARASKVADPYVLKLWLVKQDGDWLVRRVQLSGMRSLENL